MEKVNNKKIAKNTLFLYFRMIVVLGVTLYTARVVLNTLGFQDYGIYNLVAGVVVLFTFLNNSMTACTQRYLCVALGKDDTGYEKDVFSSSIISHFIIVGLFLILAETGGLWFVTQVLNIPEGKKTIAIVVYQFAILNSIFNILRVPFNAAIISHEKMNFYAISSVVEAFLKLIILAPLVYITVNKLILFSILMCGIGLALLAWYMIFVYHHFPNCRLEKKHFRKPLIEEMMKFTGWSNFSSIANIGARQGLGFILNFFFGVIINATVGIMHQVTTAVYGFINNFQTAINPPLIKLYTTGNWVELKKLFVRTAKISFYLMVILSLPLIANINPVLALWLKNVPEYTNYFCTLSLISLLPNVIGGPIWTIIQASGNLKKYQSLISLVIILNLPGDYLLLKFGFPPYCVLVLTLIINILVVLIGMKYTAMYANIKTTLIFKDVILPCVLVLAYGLLICYCINIAFRDANMSLIYLFLKIGIQVFLITTGIYFLGLKSHERFYIKNLIVNKLKRK